ncbi:hypothetical protein NFI96_017103 [Prochilodus magdalenae]|nr:hypothetical protein NFI96_017103 [Prochilodus magdalenae]
MFQKSIMPYGGENMDVWDEELNDDLLRSDEEDLTTSCQEVNILPATDLTSSCDPCGPLKESLANETFLGQRGHVFGFEEAVPSAAKAELRLVLANSGVALHLECAHEDGTAQISEELRGFAGEQQAGEEPDHGEVSDVQIDGPVGDEFQEPPREPVRQQVEEDSSSKTRDKENCSLHIKPERRATATVIRSSSAASRKRPLTEALELCKEVRPALWSHENKLGRSDRGGPQGDTQAVSDSSSLLHVQTNPAGIHHAGFPGQHMFVQQHLTSELDSIPVLHGPFPMGAVLRPKCSRDQGRPLCFQQSNLDVSNPEKTYPASQFIPGGTSLQPASSSSTHSALQEEVMQCVCAICLSKTSAVWEPESPSKSEPAAYPPPETTVAYKLCASHDSCLPTFSAQRIPEQPSEPTCPCVLRHHQTQNEPKSCSVSLCQVRIPPDRSRALKDPPVLAHNSPFINADRPTPTPAAQARPYARAVATGMPGAARQQASARVEACARTIPEPVLAGKSRGQEVKEEPQSPQSFPAKKEEREERQDEESSPYQSRAGEGEGDGVVVVPAWYRLQLEKQKRLRETLVLHKEKRRHLQARQSRKQRQERFIKVFHEMVPNQYPQVKSKQVQNLQKSRPSNLNLLQHQEIHPDHQLQQQQQRHGSELLLPVGQGSATGVASVRRAVLWHGPSFPGQGFVEGDNERSVVFPGDLEERHGMIRTIVMKRVVNKLPSNVRELNPSRMKEEEDGMRLKSTAHVNKGSRVVTFTQTPHIVHREVCPNLRGWIATNQPRDKQTAEGQTKLVKSAWARRSLRVAVQGHAGAGPGQMGSARAVPTQTDEQASGWCACVRARLLSPCQLKGFSLSATGVRMKKLLMFAQSFISDHRTLPTGRCPQDAAHRTLPTGRCPQDAFGMIVLWLPGERYLSDCIVPSVKFGAVGIMVCGCCSGVGSYP